MIREKKRYLLVDMSEAFAAEQDFERLLDMQILKCAGEISYYRINPKITKVISPNTFIIRSRHKGMRRLILALAMIKRIADRPVAFYTLKMSGLPSHLEVRQNAKSDSSKDTH